MTVTVGQYLQELKDYYKATGDLNVPYAYSRRTGNVTDYPTDAYVAQTDQMINTCYGYNIRNKQTIESCIQSVETADNVVTYTQHFKLFLYDMFYGVKPWELGINRKAFAFEDVVVLEGSFDAYDNGDGVNAAFGDNFKITLSFYQPRTGKLEAKKVLTVMPVTIYIANYWVDLTPFESDYTGSDKFYPLSVLADLEIFGVDTYTYTIPNNPLSYQEVMVSELVVSDGSLQKQVITTKYFNDPISRLNYVSALDTGVWSNYPLGNSPQEFVARKLGLPFNNHYSTTQTGAGVMQILEAVQADLEYDYFNDPANAGVNFADIRSLYQAVQNYSSVMAANICSAYRLPRSFNQLFQVKIDRAFFYNSEWPGVLDDAIRETMLFVKEDYSLSDDVDTLVNYLKKYWSYMGSDGKYYNMVNGEHVKRLGAAASSVQMILDTYKQAQLDAAWVAEIRERNILMEQARFQGSFELLDKSFTPQPGVEMTAYIGMMNAKVICTGYSVSIDTAGNFRTSVNYIKKMG